MCLTQKQLSARTLGLWPEEMVKVPLERLSSLGGQALLPLEHTGIQLDEEDGALLELVRGDTVGSDARGLQQFTSVSSLKCQLGK